MVQRQDMIQSARAHIASLFQQGAIDQLLKISLDVVFEVLMQHEVCLVKDNASVKHPKDQVDDIKEETNSSCLDLAHASEAQILTGLPESELSYEKLTDEKLTSRDAVAIVNSGGDQILEESWHTYGKHTDDQAINLPTLLEGQEQRGSPMGTWKRSSLNPEKIGKQARAAANPPRSFDERLSLIPKQYAVHYRKQQKERHARQQQAGFKLAHRWERVTQERLESELLLEACRDGEVDILRDVLKRGNASLEPEDPLTGERLPLLTEASGEGHLDVVKCLLSEFNANVHARDDISSITALINASCRGQLDVVKYLIQYAGADVLDANLNGGTPLHHAAFGGHVKVVQFLCSHAGADVFGADHHGHLPQQWAENQAFKYANDPEMAEYVSRLIDTVRFLRTWAKRAMAGLPFNELLT